MSFWKFCEKVTGFIGTTRTLDNIHLIYQRWESNIKIEDVADEILKDRFLPVSPK